MPETAIIWGASGHAKVVLELLGLTPKYAVVGCVDDVNYDRHGAFFCGCQILPVHNVEELKLTGVLNVFLGFGQCKGRLRVGRELLREGFALPPLVHPDASVSDAATLGPGSIILAGARVDPGAQIGAFAIVNNCSVVCHDCILGDAVHVCPNVSIGGSTCVGEGTWLGIGSSVIDKVTIGAGTLVGAGSVVVTDLPTQVLAYGNPARVVRRVCYDF